MTPEPPDEARLTDDRRRDDRRSDWVRLADYPLPELRKAAVTGVLLLGIGLLFAYMVREVLVAVVAGLVLGAYLIPFQRRLERLLPGSRSVAVLTITLVTVPLVAVLVYSWTEISSSAAYLQQNRQEVAAQLNAALHRLPYTEGIEIEDDLTRLVTAAAERTRQIVEELQEVLDIVVISVAVFLFTVYYILTDSEAILLYVRSRVPGRYRDLAGEVSGNVRAVVYGALYATFLTQLMKSALILGLNLLFGVPLAIVLAILSFFIGFFPIVGSWAVYVPVAVYLMVFQENLYGGAAMLVIGFFGNTLFLSMYLRPKIAAEKSQVLNFYWMFLALVTGVYTFGLVGIIIGPVLVGVLKAIFDTVTDPADRRVAATVAAEPEPG